MNRQGFGGEMEAKRMWADTSSPHGFTPRAVNN